MPPQPGVRALGESTRIDTRPTTSADFVVASNIGGIALDTNLLTRPTQRRLVALWCEQAGQQIAVLPQVRNELMQRGVRTGRSVAVRIEAWEALLEEPATPYRPVSLDGPDVDLCERVLASLTVPCFPQLSSADEIPANSDAVIIAESVACGMKMLVTNNMRSLDHAEVNGLVKELWGRDKVLVHADVAMVDAHQHGEAARELLRLALASCWPEQEPSSPSHADLRAVEGRVASLCDRLVGAGLPMVSAKIANRFETDADLAQIVASAQALACESTVLAHERLFSSWVRKGRVDASMLAQVAEE